MSQRVSDRAYEASRKRAGSRRRSWISRILLVLIGIVVIVPVSLIFLFRFVPPPITPLMLATILTDGPISQRWVPLDAISPNLVRAVIGSEDSKFCSHYGFDLAAIDKALAANASGGNLRGASTISQQTAKNLFLSPDRTWTRKGIEAYLTVLLEALWPKRRIMETYLNIAEWGPRRFGAEAAAETDFHKPAAKLSVMEAARLATILPNPRTYPPESTVPHTPRQSGVISALHTQT